MDKERVKEILLALLDDMLESFKSCEPELKRSYAQTIMELLDRIFALDRKLNV